MPKKNPMAAPQPAEGPDDGGDRQGKTWTRGNDPQAAAEALMAANRGSSGGELNVTIPKTTPRA